MIGHEPHRYWKIMWKFVAPVFIAILLGATLVSKFLKPITYNVYSYTEVIRTRCRICETSNMNKTATARLFAF